MENNFNHIWEKWDVGKLEAQISSHKKERKVYLDIIEEYIKDGKGKKILELGCGSSIDARIIAERTDVEVYGIDISEEALKIAGNIEPYFQRKIILFKDNALKLQFNNEEFDLVFSQGLLEHFDNPYRALKEQLRVLKPGGVLIVNVPQRYTAYTLYKHLEDFLGNWEWGHETEFSNSRLKNLGQLLDLEVLAKQGYGWWMSPFEPAFVLRTLNTKLEKLPLVRKCPVHKTISNFWKKIWGSLERRYGHLFMKNIVYVYRKK